MRVVIVRIFKASAEEMPVTQWAKRVDDLFRGDEFEWTGDKEQAAVFPDRELADAQAKMLGSGCYPVIRSADESQAAPASRPAMVATAEPARAAAVRGVSPSQMAAGDTKARIHAAKHNRRVAVARRTAEDFRRVYEATCARLGERDADD